MIEWNCWKCGEVITKGGIGISYMDINKAEKATEEWKEKHPRGTLISGSELMEYPRSAQWYITCKNCDPTSDNGYWINIDRIDTYPKLIEWTAHLMGKNWFMITDWDHVLRKQVPPGQMA